jgi:hypothetical protein
VIHPPLKEDKFTMLIKIYALDFNPPYRGARGVNNGLSIASIMWLGGSRIDLQSLFAGMGQGIST